MNISTNHVFSKLPIFLIWAVVCLTHQTSWGQSNTLEVKQGEGTISLFLDETVNKYGFQYADGTIAVLPKLDEIKTYCMYNGPWAKGKKPFCDIVFMVRQNGKCGLVDPKGKTLLPIIHDTIHGITWGHDCQPAVDFFVLTKNKKKAMLFVPDWNVSEFTYDELRVHSARDCYTAPKPYEKKIMYRIGNKTGVMDCHFKPLFPPLKNYSFLNWNLDLDVYMKNVGGNYLQVYSTKNGPDYGTGLIDLEGNWILPIAKNWRVGLGSVFNDPTRSFLHIEQRLEGGIRREWILDENGELLFTPKNHKKKYYSKSWVDVERYAKGSPWGVEKFDGEIVIPYAYQSCKMLNEKIYKNKGFYRMERLGFLMQNTDSKYGVFDLDGKPILPFEFDKIELVDSVFLVTKGGTQLLLNQNNEVVFDQMDRFWKWKHSFFAIRNDSLYGMRNDHFELCNAENFAFTDKTKIFQKTLLVNAGGRLLLELPSSKTYLNQKGDYIYYKDKSTVELVNIKTGEQLVYATDVKELKFRSNQMLIVRGDLIIEIFDYNEGKIIEVYPK